MAIFVPLPSNLGEEGGLKRDLYATILRELKNFFGKDNK